MPNAPARIYNAHLAFKRSSKRPKSYVLSGIAGDARHGYGYHVDPNHLPNSDYSLQLTRDRRGAKKYPNDASAWDLSFSRSDMVKITNRLLAAARKRDPRIVNSVREFCGTRDNKNTYPYDVQANASEGVNSWEDSHLWHIHVSFLRDATAAQMLAFVDVLLGIPAKRVSKPIPIPTSDPRPVKIKNPFPLAGKNVFGDISGPATFHGGFYASERANVRKIQIFLQKKAGAPKARGWADGRYGPPTTKYVAHWQKAHKLPATGEVDKRTWEAMFK